MSNRTGDRGTKEPNTADPRVDGVQINPITAQTMSFNPHTR